MGIEQRIISDKDIAALVKGVGFPEGADAVAFATILAESGGNAWAINMNTHDEASPSYLSLDVGICQFNTFWNPGLDIQDLFEPMYSVHKMFEVWTGSGFKPWNAYNDYKHVKFIPRALEALAG